MIFRSVPEWQRLYVEALVEPDAAALAKRVAVAEKAILLRVGELCISSDQKTEWQAIEDAISGIALLKREILKSSIAAETESKPTAITRRDCYI